MKIDDATVDRIAHLSKLEFDAESKAVIQQDLNKIIEFIDKLEELNTDDVAPLKFITDEVNVLREDEVSNEVSQHDALKNAPKKDSDYFKLPKVLNK